MNVCLWKVEVIILPNEQLWEFLTDVHSLPESRWLYENEVKAMYAAILWHQPVVEVEELTELYLLILT